MKKEQFRKELEDCWDAAVEYYDYVKSKPIGYRDGKFPDRKEYLTTRLAALDDGDEPKIVCLCGSVRFAEWFHKYEFNLSVEGVIVLAPCAYNNDVQVSNPDAKKAFDKLHMAKIDMCNEVIVLNIGGYIGESTRNEINYAIKTGKPIKYHEPT